MASTGSTAASSASLVAADFAEGAAKTAGSVGGAVSEAGKKLYKEAVQAAGATSSATRTAASEAGDGPFARAIKAGRRYSDGLYEHLRAWQDFHDGMHGDLGTAIERSSGLQSQFSESLTGEAGDAVQADLQANHRLWGAHQDKHESASQASHTAAWKVSNAQGEIDDLAESGEREFNSAVRQRNPVAALDVYTRYSTDADNVVAKYHPQVVQLLQNAGFDFPLSPQNGNNDGTSEPGSHNEKKGDGSPGDHDGDGSKPNDGRTANNHVATPANSTNPVDGNPNRSNETVSAADHTPRVVPADQTTANTANAASPTEHDVSAGAFPQRIPQMPSGGSGGSGSSGSGGSGLGSMGSGLGQGMKPPSSMGSLPGANAPTSPASSLPGGSPGQASPSPLANAGQNFNSGLASGMGGSGGMAPAMPPHDQALQQMASQQPMVAPPTAPVSPAGMPPTTGWTPTPDPSSVGHGGGVAAGGGMGGTMMPPTAMGSAQPLAPYTPAGSGAGGGGGATSSATAGGGSGAAPASPASTTPAGAAPPVLAGNPGSSAAMAALAGTSRDLNPDVALAQRVLAELVAGSDASTTLATWAVSVLRSSFGAQVYVASNMGGGWYLPASVYLPTTAKLAVADPALPASWAQNWMGSQKPSRILIDHFTHLQESANKIPGLAFSALVTTDRAVTPSDFTGDYVAMEHMEARALCPETPQLDAEHQHRLTTIHSGLAARVFNIAIGHPSAAQTAATSITKLVFDGLKSLPDQLGPDQSMEVDDDARMLDLVNRGQASEEAWAEYDAAVQIRGGGAVMWPEQFQGVQDNDDSETARHAMRLYEHFYRTSRFVELVNCWRRQPPALSDVVYCAITAGFGGQVVQVLNEVELRAGARQT